MSLKSSVVATLKDFESSISLLLLHLKENLKVEKILLVIIFFAIFWFFYFIQESISSSLPCSSSITCNSSFISKVRLYMYAIT